MSRALELWKQLGVERAEFVFDCGGDSMGDTQVLLYDKDDELIENSELDGIFHDEVYNNVEFYENSNGHYEGESGTVHITLDDDGTDFNYSKESLSQYNETNEETMQIEMPDEMIKFIQDNVFNINGGEGNIVVNFKRDFIMTDAEIDLQEELENLISQKTTDFTPDVDGTLEDWFTFTTNDEGEELTIEGNCLNVEMRNQYTVYKDDNED